MALQQRAKQGQYTPTTLKMGKNVQLDMNASNRVRKALASMACIRCIFSTVPINMDASGNLLLVLKHDGHTREVAVNAAEYTLKGDAATA